MTTPVRELTTLTDDEVVAVAVEFGSQWPAPLPTVDAGDADALSFALLRGRRSLVVRGLTSNDQAGYEIDQVLVDDLRPAISGAVLLGSFVATHDLAFVPEGTSVVVYADGSGDALVESISGGGVHYFSVRTVDDAIAAFRGLMCDVFTSGLEVRTDTEMLSDVLVQCVTGRVDSELMAVVAKGRIRLLSVGADGTVQPLPEIANVDEVLDVLLPTS